MVNIGNLTVNVELTDEFKEYLEEVKEKSNKDVYSREEKRELAEQISERLSEEVELSVEADS